MLNNNTYLTAWDCFDSIPEFTYYFSCIQSNGRGVLGIKGENGENRLFFFLNSALFGTKDVTATEFDRFVMDNINNPAFFDCLDSFKAEFDN